jgi:acetyltransferase-like isoleucine patch superfamily enzyme
MTTYKLYLNVRIGEGAQIGDFVSIGVPPQGAEPGDLRTMVGSGAVIRSNTVIYAGNCIGDRFHTGHGVMVRELNEIGNNVSIGSHSIVEHHVSIGDGVRIHSQAFIPEYCVLEEDCWIGPNVVLTNARYPLAPTAKETLEGPIIKSNAKIGANATILPGIVIGEWSLIGAGAVVTENIPPGCVAVGNPARIVRDVGDLGVYELNTLYGGHNESSAG